MTASLMPMPKQAFFATVNGVHGPIVDGYVYFYESGTVTTPKNAYTTAAGTTPTANPIRLNARGEPTTGVFLGSGAYTIKLCDAGNAEVWTEDGVQAMSHNQASLIDFTQAGTGAVTRTVQDKQRESVSIKDFGGIGDGTLHTVAEWIIPGALGRFASLAALQVEYPHVTSASDSIDWAAGQAGLNALKSLYLPHGEYVTNAPLTFANAGQRIKGDGAFNSTLKVDASFAGSAAVIVGNKTSTTIVAALGLSDFDIDCNNMSVSGFEVYGARDGSRFDSVYVHSFNNVVGIKTGMAGNGAGVAAGKMCQGVIFTSTHAISDQNFSSKSLWQLDGLFESQLIGCKALGSSGATITDTTGFKIGSIAEARGVALIGCSAGSFRTSGNFGIHYADWARECWDQFTTLEAIIGSGVYFHGSLASGTLNPALCKSLDCRPYSLADAGLLDPLYRFGDANGCHAGVVSYYNSAKVWGRFDDAVASQFNNSIEIKAGTLPSSILSTIISFDAGCSASSMVYGYSSEDTTQRKKIFFNAGGATWSHEANGYHEYHDGTTSTIVLPTSGRYRWKSAALDTILDVDVALGTITPKIATVMGGAWDSPSLMQLGSYRLWVDASGRLRIKFGTPTSDTDGTIIGTQS